jgi:pyruvate, water dikinase
LRREEGMAKDNAYVAWFDHLDSGDVEKVGGKNASLGEMIKRLKKAGIQVPGGFATTADAYWEFIGFNELSEKVGNHIDSWKKEKKSLEAAGRAIRKLFRGSEFPEKIAEAIKHAYGDLNKKYAPKGKKEEESDVAVRSSATAEDLPEASFAGQQETFLNVRGEEELMEACKRCYASLFTDRAIAYRAEHGFDDMKVALSIGVQKMVRSDKAGSGVMFSIDTETGLRMRC